MQGKYCTAEPHPPISRAAFGFLKPSGLQPQGSECLIPLLPLSWTSVRICFQPFPGGPELGDLYGCSSLGVSRFPGDLRAQGGMVGELNREGGSPGSLATDFLASSIPPHTVLLSEGEGDGRRGIQLHREYPRGPTDVGRAWDAHTAPSEGSRSARVLNVSGILES